MESLVEQYCDAKYMDQWDIDGFNHQYQNTFNVVPPKDWEQQDFTKESLLEYFFEETQRLYQEKLKTLRSGLEASHSFTDEEFKKFITDVERQMVLEINDNLWKDHLLSMDHLRENVGFVGYAQKKPLDEYKRQGFALFSDLMARISAEVVNTFYRLRITSSEPPPVKERPQQEMKMSHADYDEVREQQKPQPAKKQQTIGRNDPCPCGSGKKYKKCHGAQADAGA